VGSRRPRKAEQCSGKQRHPDRAAAEAHVFALARAGGMLKRLRGVSVPVLRVLACGAQAEAAAAAVSASTERGGGIGSDRVEPTLPASTDGLDRRADTDGGSST
jgi:hypothetical protein